MNDIEIANLVQPLPIKKIAEKLNITEEELIYYGKYKAKINKPIGAHKAKLILVTAMNPTKAGEGKTTVSIGLADALQRLNNKVCLALREPSLGPVFGIKGGATGGGYSQVIPMEEINLHFTGDFHAITSANNLLCSLIDNHIFFGNELEIDKNQIFFYRCLDLNERQLREVEFKSGTNRKESFTITAASEIMAIMCVAKDLNDLKTKISNILIALNTKGQPVFVKDLHAEDCITILLKEALMPNLVQTLEGTPAIIHCGPFANIAHGCNSIIATNLACSVADYVVTEAGFGADLGAEKFLDFKCRLANLQPDCVVIVATIRALKLHGGVSFENLREENIDVLKNGYANLKKHIETIESVYKLPYIVTLNKFSDDTDNEIDYLKSKLNDKLVINKVWAEGGNGGIDLAKAVISKCQIKNTNFSYAYNLEDSIYNKIEKIVQNVYGGKDIFLSENAKQSIKQIEEFGFSNLPIIIAKTQFSLSGDSKLLGAPKGFTMQVDDVQLHSGAGFIVAICGKTMLMPALSKTPAALNMQIDKDGVIKGLF